LPLRTRVAGSKSAPPRATSPSKCHPARRSTSMATAPPSTSWIGATGSGLSASGWERIASARAGSTPDPRPAPLKPANLVTERTRQRMRATCPLTRREVVGADMGDHAHGAPEGADAVFAQDQPEHERHHLAVQLVAAIAD